MRELSLLIVSVIQLIALLGDLLVQKNGLTTSYTIHFSTSSKFLSLVSPYTSMIPPYFPTFRPSSMPCTFLIPFASVSFMVCNLFSKPLSLCLPFAAQYYLLSTIAKAAIQLTFIVNTSALLVYIFLLVPSLWLATLWIS